MGLFSYEKEFFGLDIGTSNIRLAQFRRSSGKYSLIAYGSVGIPFGLSQSDSSMDIKQLSEIIKRLVKDCKVTTKNIVVALPSSQIYTAIVKMPQMSSSEIDKAVKWQAEQNIPLKIEEVRVDWQLVSPSVGPRQEVAVMIVAAPNQKIERLMQVAKASDLSVLYLETIPAALSRSLNTSGTTVMMVDIGALTTEIAVIRDEVVFHSRSLPIAGFAFTRAMSQNLGLDINQAEQFKRKFGLVEEKLEGEIVKTLTPLLNGIVDEIKRSIKFYQEQFGGNIEKVILSGGSARLPGLSSFLSQILETDVQICNPWDNIAYPPSIQQNLLDTSAEYATAVGLAKRK